MSLTQRLGVLVVAIFAIAFTRMPWLIQFLNPVMRRLLQTPLPAGPNALLTVRGRRSGRLRSSPVAFLDLGERGLLQAASAEVDWVSNLRASREAVITRKGESKTYEATELAPDAAGRLLCKPLAPFPKSRLIRAVVGPMDRPPVAVLHYFRLRVDDNLDDYVALGRRQPVFELRRSKSSG